MSTHDTPEAVEAMADVLDNVRLQGLEDLCLDAAAMLRRLHQRAVDAERERDEARFSPMGDNHHNAAACPYCNPLLKASLATARTDALLAKAREEGREAGYKDGEKAEREACALLSVDPKNHAPGWEGIATGTYIHEAICARGSK